VHVPWCRRRCPYCAFYVEVDRGPDHAAFTDAVVREIALRAPAFRTLGRASTLFFGGGTPSRLPATELARIVAALELADDAEVTVEANPEDLDDDTLGALLDAGVTRLSVGLQTFDERFARLLNRASTVGEARQALARVAQAGFASWSVDLIFGLPGQSLADLDRDLDGLARVGPPHVSLYGLTFEPGTPFERARQRGRLVPLDDDAARRMMDRIAARLQELGLERYEVSNFARPGQESRHNTLYWTDRPYLGLGPSSHGYAPDGSRWNNLADVIAYQQRPDPTEQAEVPDPWQAATDLVISSLRGSRGLDLDRLRARTGLGPRSEVVGALVGAGLLEHAEARLRLCADGVAVCDAITARLVDALQPVTPATQ
jgi:oxygen-independent coproporphyrinogen-3 oxidase